MKKLLAILGAIPLAILISVNASALPIEKIINGDFETGLFTGWTVANANTESGWDINDGIDPMLDPKPDVEFSRAPINGKFDAITITPSAPTNPPLPNSNRLSQNFDVPDEYLTSAVLSWSDRIFNFASDFIEGQQEFRVEILNGADAIEEVFSTAHGDPGNQEGPNARSFDITDLLRGFAGQTLTLSFLELDDPDAFLLAVDDISLQIQTAPVPEPATMVLLSSGLIALAGFGCRKRQRK